MHCSRKAKWQRKTWLSLKFPIFGMTLFNANLVICTQDSHSMLVSLSNFSRRKALYISTRSLCRVSFKKNGSVMFSPTGTFVSLSHLALIENSRTDPQTHERKLSRETKKARRRLGALKSVEGRLFKFKVELLGRLHWRMEQLSQDLKEARKCGWRVTGGWRVQLRNNALSGTNTQQSQVSWC